MTKKQQKHTKEFKLETIELARTSGKNDSQLERELGLSRGCLYHWRKEVQREGPQAFPGKGRLKADDEYVRGLERELAIVQQERDILKKALAIFTRSQR
ncbi:MAG TPA: transposase [Anaerolineae bacterium]|nr:transposase [Anaerolineae bacterium]